MLEMNQNLIERKTLTCGLFIPHGTHWSGRDSLSLWQGEHHSPSKLTIIYIVQLVCSCKWYMFAEANSSVSCTCYLALESRCGGWQQSIFHSVSQFLNRSSLVSTVPVLFFACVSSNASRRRIARSRTSMSLTEDRANPSPIDMVLIMPIPCSSTLSSCAVRFVRYRTGRGPRSRISWHWLWFWYINIFSRPYGGIGTCGEAVQNFLSYTKLYISLPRHLGKARYETV